MVKRKYDAADSTLCDEPTADVGRYEKRAVGHRVERKQETQSKRTSLHRNRYELRQKPFGKFIHVSSSFDRVSSSTAEPNVEYVLSSLIMRESSPFSASASDTIVVSKITLVRLVGISTESDSPGALERSYSILCFLRKRRKSPQSGKLS